MFSKSFLNRVLINTSQISPGALYFPSCNWQKTWNNVCSEPKASECSCRQPCVRMPELG